MYGHERGLTPGPGHALAVVGIEAPIVAGTARADAGGTATMSVFVPSRAAGREVELQAIEVDSGRISEVIRVRFD